DEEIGGFNGTKYQVEQGIDADFVLVGETSSDFTFGIKSKGIIWVKAYFTGKAAHGAYPWNGNNAILKANEFLQKLKIAYPIPQKESWATTVNVAKIETANATFNKVPEDAVVWLDIRYIPEDKDSVLEKIRSMVSKDVKVETLVNEPAHLTEKNNKYINQLGVSYQKVTGKEGMLVGKHGGSDLRHFPHSATIEFGPIGANPHTDKEWVDIKSLLTYHKIVTEFLLDLN
ncbi:MAG: M20/M25/M40 family metallo-hydrolase, partial [Patescibacteria group bacterium]